MLSYKERRRVAAVTTESATDMSEMLPPPRGPAGNLRLVYDVPPWQWAVGNGPWAMGRGQETMENDEEIPNKLQS